MQVIDPRRGPTVWVEEVAFHRQELAATFDVITMLPGREGQTLLLRIVGFSVDETAHHLGVSPKTVEGRSTRARTRLRQIHEMADWPSATIAPPVAHSAAKLAHWSESAR